MINIEGYKFLGKTVYSALDVQDTVKDKILQLLFKFENISMEQFWNYRNNHIQIGKAFILKHKLE